uniref:Uncharacterized protein n=1 Tax=Romanomermis culicivorax TaxID=13658 RepID=A0A915J0S9_ROMCU
MPKNFGATAPNWADANLEPKNLTPSCFISGSVEDPRRHENHDETPEWSAFLDERIIEGDVGGAVVIAPVGLGGAGTSDGVRTLEDKSSQHLSLIIGIILNLMDFSFRRTDIQKLDKESSIVWGGLGIGFDQVGGPPPFSLLQ